MKCFGYLSDNNYMLLRNIIIICNCCIVLFHNFDLYLLKRHFYNIYKKLNFNIVILLYTKF